MPEPIYALTSLSPSPSSEAVQKASITSWRAAGLTPIAFASPADAAELRKRYDIEFVEVENTTEALFGRPFVPISTMMKHAERLDAPVLLINSDVSLALSPLEMQRIRNIADEGLCYFVRYNHRGDIEQATKEGGGIDGFLFHGRHAKLFGDSFLSMGQPWWDYWLPHAFSAAGLPVWSVEFPCAYHLAHPQRWAPEAADKCCAEFKRLAGLASSEDAYHLAVRIRKEFERSTKIDEIRVRH